MEASKRPTYAAMWHRRSICRNKMNCFCSRKYVLVDVYDSNTKVPQLFLMGLGYLERQDVWSFWSFLAIRDLNRDQVVQPNGTIQSYL